MYLDLEHPVKMRMVDLDDIEVTHWGDLGELDDCSAPVGGCGSLGAL